MPKKYQLILICNEFPTPFQAYDEGSIPFTRSTLTFRRPQWTLRGRNLNFPRVKSQSRGLRRQTLRGKCRCRLGV